MGDSNTKDKVLWYDEAVALQQDGELAKAIREIKALLEVYPDYGLAWLALAVFSQERGDEETTLDAMQKACEIEQDDPFYFTAFSALAIWVEKCRDSFQLKAPFFSIYCLRVMPSTSSMTIYSIPSQ